MNLSDFAKQYKTRLETPEVEWRPSNIGTANEAVVVSQPLVGNPSHDDVLRENGYPPEEWELVGDMNYNRRTLVSGESVTSYRFKVRRRTDTVDLPALFSAVERSRPSKVSEQGSKRALVVGWADPQTGKTGSRGGSPELVARVLDKREKLQRYIEEQGTTSAFFIDAGDSIEGFENTAQQQFTNDLSLMDQLDLEATLEQKMIELLAATHTEVSVVGVGSNHCAWRQGKGKLGKPADDWGLFIKRQLKRAFDTNPDAYGHVKFYEPAEWDETIVIDVLGTGVGVAHGHQKSSPDQIPNFWREQVHGAQPLAHADVLLTGHFHTFRLQPTGRSLRTGRSKWWLQLPTLDNGSDWYRNIKGEDSDPGLAVFVVDENGFNLQSVAIL